MLSFSHIVFIRYFVWFAINFHGELRCDCVFRFVIPIADIRSDICPGKNALSITCWQKIRRKKDKLRREQLLLSFLPSIVVQISVYCLANQRDRMRIEERRTVLVLYWTNQPRRNGREPDIFRRGIYEFWTPSFSALCGFHGLRNNGQQDRERGRGRERHFLPGFLIDNHRIPCLIKALYNTTAQ